MAATVPKPHVAATSFTGNAAPSSSSRARARRLQNSQTPGLAPLAPWKRRCSTPGPGAYARTHVTGAANLPHKEITAERMAAWLESTLFVVYRAGPHCNGADHAALRLTRGAIGETPRRKSSD